MATASDTDIDSDVCHISSILPRNPAEAEKVRSRPPRRTADSPVDSRRMAPKPRCLIGEGGGDGLPTIVCQSYGGGCEGGQVESFRAASYISGRSSISALAKRRNLSLRAAKDRNNLGPSNCEESERVEKKATPAQCDGDDGGRGVRGLPNLVTAPAPLPTVRAKGGKEGNFVKLNINGYERRKFGKSGRKGEVSGRYSRRTKGKALSVSVSDAGFIEEDGLVLQDLNLKDLKGKVAMVQDESVDEAITMT